MTDSSRTAGPAPGPAGSETDDATSTDEGTKVTEQQDRARVDAQAEAMTGGVPDPVEPPAPDDTAGDGAVSTEDTAGPTKFEGDQLAEAQPAGTDGSGTTPDSAGTDGGLGAELAALRAGLDERTTDLQRITAEYANYRKRVDRDKTMVVEQATGNVLGALLPVLDDLDRAREHGDLSGPMAAVADQLVATVQKFGLSAFGAKGDAFDPTVHEAVAHSTSAEVTEPTCVEIMRRGYLLGERLLRPALVAVADPE